MSEQVVIALCVGIGGLISWTIKVLLRVERRLTRVETKLLKRKDDKDDENTEFFT